MSSPARLQAVVFDVDGLLVDTETPDYHAWRELYAGFGLELTLGEYACQAGLYGSWERAYEELAERTGVPAADLHARREPRFRELVAASLRPSPGLLRLLAELDRHAVPRAVASSSDPDWIEYLLEGLGLRGRFPVVVSGQDVPRRKPAPDVYQAAVGRLGVDPLGSVALEDSSHGVQAARSAGLIVVAVPNVVSREQDLSGAHHRAESLGEVDLPLLRNLVRGRGRQTPRAGR